MRRTVGRVVLLVALALGAGGALAQAPSFPDADSLDAVVRQGMREWRVPGLAVAITQGAQPFYSRAFGEGAEGQPLSPRAPFLLGSTSKAFTALTVLQLVEERRLELDAPVRRYLPALAPRGPDADTVTLRHLLTHTSGIPTAAGFRALPEEDDAWRTLSLDDVTLAHPPGTAFAYSNLNYALLGQVVQAVTGERFETRLRTHVLGPLGTRATFGSREEAERAGLAPGHFSLFGWPVRSPEPAYSRASIPAGFIAASAEDVSRLLGLLLARGRLPDGSRLVSEETVALLTRPWDGQERGYAMGWRAARWYGTPVLLHEGLTGRYSSMVVLVPERELGLVLLTNLNSFDAGTELMDALLARILRQPPQPSTRERWVRLGALGLLGAVLVGFAWRLWRWRRAGSPLGLARSRRVLGGLLARTALAVGLLLAISWRWGMSPGQLLRFQPDLGGLLLLGTVLGVSGALLKALVDSRSASTGR